MLHAWNVVWYISAYQEESSILICCEGNSLFFFVRDILQAFILFFTLSYFTHFIASVFSKKPVPLKNSNWTNTGADINVWMKYVLDGLLSSLWQQTCKLTITRYNSYYQNSQKRLCSNETVNWYANKYLNLNCWIKSTI